MQCYFELLVSVYTKIFPYNPVDHFIHQSEVQHLQKASEGN